jgi:hypothetical protein
MKQTAVEWYEIEISSLFEKYEAKEISKRDFITIKHNLFYQAKEMEKQQIKDGYISGMYDAHSKTSIDYYKENYETTL